MGLFKHVVNTKGESPAQSWKQNVGLANYSRLFTEGNLASQFLKAFTWTVIFAFGSVLLTFCLGFFLALTLNDDRIKGKKLYRSFLLLPYAVPGFISLLIWSNFYNQDFGLINQMLHLNIRWLSDPTMAKIAVLLTNTWMGFPYMFIVCTGALQSISGDVKEAAKMDGATGMQATLRIITPLLLVAVAPLLVSTFAFNFNNFNAIQLLTEGGPFPAGSTHAAEPTSSSPWSTASPSAVPARTSDSPRPSPWSCSPSPASWPHCSSEPPRSSKTSTDQPTSERTSS